ncbi:NACHT C-terminal alpha/beta 1 domain-containing protein, partial [Prochlorothrix hollandica]|uniref:NACHT C-terminal alpha/beta 1 domain-containing protein n=1 Tax=Prochlorothrix hollandica TaxID=1223 RepID=UPI003DA74778
KTKDMAYPEFWQAWNQPQTSIHPEMAEITPIGSTPQTQQLNNQLLNLSTQLSPTATTHPLCLNLSGLQTLSDRAELCQALALLSYEAIDPSFDTLDIPENIHTPTQLKTALLKLRKYLKTPEIAIIIHNSDPTPEILDILTVLSPSFPIAWITDQPHPHRSFLPTAANLPQLLQTWLTRS